LLCFYVNVIDDYCARIQPRIVKSILRKLNEPPLGAAPTNNQRHAVCRNAQPKRLGKSKDWG
jgi:hypothetical protein